MSRRPSASPDSELNVPAANPIESPPVDDLATGVITAASSEIRSVAKARNTRGRKGTGARAQLRITPALFDRLCDEAPHAKHDPNEEWAISPSRLREIVQRDIGLLLNTTSLGGLLDREKYPAVAVSTLNFGIPPLAGTHASDYNWDNVKAIIDRAIRVFEPRLIAESLDVRPLARSRDGEGHNVMSFEIWGMITVEPHPLAFSVRSSVDLETRRIRVGDSAKGPVRRIVR